jgi:Tfp pilus assembly protein PilF/4-amino-4-deoxy-L-arabinose transferase-like glycosyltransferase
VEAVDPLGRRERLVLLAILLCAAALRIGFVLGQRGDVLFDHPQLDEQRYVREARDLVSGRSGEERPYWQPPGVIFATAAVMAVAGQGLLAPRIVQALISTGACWILFLLGRRLFGTRVALVAAALLALHGAVIFESYLLLPQTWILFFDLLALWLLYREARSAGRALAVGVTIGVSALFSPTILPFAVVAAWWQRRPLWIAALVGGVLLPIAPVAARNFMHGGEAVLISTNGGLNLYLGNNERYEETIALRPGRHWEQLTTEPDRGGITAPGARSDYFRARALDFMVQHPGRAAALYARKLYLYFNGGEIARDRDVNAARRDSTLMRLLVWRSIPDGLLLPLALLGLVLLWRWSPLWMFAALHAATTALFFVSERHRVPALGVWALLAAAGAAELWRRRSAGLSVVLVALVIALNLPTREARMSLVAEEDFQRGIAWQREVHDPEEAARWFRRATEEDPNDARAWLELAQSSAALGRFDDALDAYRHAAAVDGWDGRARRALSQMLMARGDLDGAVAVLREHIAAGLQPKRYYSSDWLNLAFLLAKQGRIAEAHHAMDMSYDADQHYYQQHVRIMQEQLGAKDNAALMAP